MYMHMHRMIWARLHNGECLGGGITVLCLPLAENLEPCTQADFPLIRHWELGRYFIGVMERGYVPNQALRNVYCEDCG